MALLTIGLAWLLPQAGHDVALEFAQRGRLQRLEVDLDLLGAGVAERGLAGLDDVDHAAQLLPRQLVDVQAELALLVVRHGRRLLLLVGVIVGEELWRLHGLNAEQHSPLFGPGGKGGAVSFSFITGNKCSSLQGRVQV